MKKLIKNNIKFIFGIVAGIIISGVVVYASIAASSITYSGTTVDKAIDNLYEKANSLGTFTKTVCTYQGDGSYGNAGEVGALYDCEVGINVHRYFYLLSDKGNKVVLIMDKNLSDTVGNHKMISWTDAIEFFELGQPGYETKRSWINVLDVDLPSAQDIVDATLVMNPKENYSFVVSTASPTWWCLGSHLQNQPNGPVYCPSDDSQKRVAWLFDWLRDCSSRGCVNNYDESDTAHSYGYWTRDIVITNTNRAYSINRNGCFTHDDKSSSVDRGVRPVITVLKSQLSN